MAQFHVCPERIIEGSFSDTFLLIGIKFVSRHVVHVHTSSELLICVLLFIHKYCNNGFVFASVQNLDFLRAAYTTIEVLFVSC